MNMFENALSRTLMRIRHFIFSLTKNEPKVVLQQEDENST
jgi:hypothetical protein